MNLCIDRGIHLKFIVFLYIVFSWTLSHFLCAVIVQPQQCVGSFVPLRPPLDIFLAIAKNAPAPRVNITWINRAVASLFLLPLVRPSLPVKRCRKLASPTTQVPPSTLWPLQSCFWFWWSCPLWKNLCTHWIVVAIDKSTSGLDDHRVLVFLPKNE